jgi:hypothetical protein
MIPKGLDIRAAKELVWQRQLDRMKEVRELLRRWNGGEAMLWSYSVSHGVLEVHITLREEKPVLRLKMSDCERIQGKTRWADASIAIQAVSREKGFVVEDTGGELRVECIAVEAFESSAKGVFPADVLREREGGEQI